MIKIFISGESGLLANAILSKLDFSKYEIINSKLDATFKNSFHYFNYNNKTIQIRNAEVDITDEKIIKKLKTVLDPNSIIIHTAAYVNTDKCENFYYEATKSNVLGTQNLIEVAKATNCVLIHFSTTAVFDPDFYMQQAGKFDETCKIDPKTIYGLTKYCSELAVKQSLDKSKFVVIKPVFIYGDWPFDNSSMLTKIIKKQFDYNYNSNDKPLNVFLDKSIEKDYMHSDYFAEMFLKILENIDLCLGKDFIISRNDPKLFKHYYELIKTLLNSNNLDELINFIPTGDYLKRHNGISTNFYNVFPNFRLAKDAFDDKIQIEHLITKIRNFYKTLYCE